MRSSSAVARLLLPALLLLVGLLASPQAFAARLSLASACVQPVGTATCTPVQATLPFLWDVDHRATSGLARFQFRFTRQPSDGDTPALLLTRAGNAVSVALNGRPLAVIGVSDPARHDTAKRPWLVPLPPGLLMDENTLEVTIIATAGRAAQLHPPRVGSFPAMQEAWGLAHQWQVETTRTLAWIAGLIGVICAVMWVVQRDPMLLACGVAQAAWAARLLETFHVRTPLPWPAWGGVVATAFVGTQLALAVYFLLAADRWSPTWRRAAIAYAAAWLVGTPIVLWSGSPMLWVSWLALATALLVAVNLHVAQVAFRERLFWRWLMVAWFAAALLAAAADAAESPGSFYLHPTWSRLAIGVFSLALVALVARQLREAHNADQARSRELRRALAQQQQRLQSLHEAEARREVERATWTERQRLMRDMHDGLGAQLYGLHALAGRPEAQRKELQGQIRQAIEELRLVVDAMNPFDGDLAAMLGDLRPPLERRLAHSQVELRWAVDELPPVGDGFSPARVQHLKRLLLEAATNIARHSGATEARLSATAKNGVLTLELADNGRGFDPNSPKAGNGLRNMRWRAMMVGAEFDIDSRNGCRIRLRMPLPAAGPATPAALPEPQGDEVRGLAPPTARA